MMRQQTSRGRHRERAAEVRGQQSGRLGGNQNNGAANIRSDSVKEAAEVSRQQRGGDSRWAEATEIREQQTQRKRHKRADRDIKGKGALAVGARQPKYSGRRHKGATKLRTQPRLGGGGEAAATSLGGNMYRVYTELRRKPRLVDNNGDLEGATDGPRQQQ